MAHGAGWRTSLGFRKEHLRHFWRDVPSTRVASNAAVAIKNILYCTHGGPVTRPTTTDRILPSHPPPINSDYGFDPLGLGKEPANLAR